MLDIIKYSILDLYAVLYPDTVRIYARTCKLHKLKLKHFSTKKAFAFKLLDGWCSLSRIFYSGHILFYMMHNFNTLACYATSNANKNTLWPVTGNRYCTLRVKVEIPVNIFMTSKGQIRMTRLSQLALFFIISKGAYSNSGLPAERALKY